MYVVSFLGGVRDINRIDILLQYSREMIVTLSLDRTCRWQRKSNDFITLRLFSLNCSRTYTSLVAFLGQLPFTVMFLLGSTVSSSVLLRSSGLVGTVMPSSMEATMQPPGTVQLPFVKIFKNTYFNKSLLHLCPKLELKINMKVKDQGFSSWLDLKENSLLSDSDYFVTFLPPSLTTYDWRAMRDSLSLDYSSVCGLKILTFVHAT